jgi:Undecaprenyl-phosphate glucose phosphotransferase
VLKLFARRIREFQIAVDSLFIAIAWYLSVWIRANVISYSQSALRETLDFWLWPLLGLTLYFFLKNGMYNRRRLPSFIDDVMQLLRANAISVVSFIVCIYFFSNIRVSRWTLLFYIVFSTFFLVMDRLVLRSLVRKLRRRGFLLQDVFVVGNGHQVLSYLEKIRYTPGVGLRVRAVFGDAPDLDGWALKSFRLDELGREIALQNPDFVVLGFEDETDPFISEFIRQNYDQLFQIQVLTPAHRTLLGLSTETVGDLHIMSLNQPRFSIPELTGKRLLDIAGSTVGLVVLSPFFFVIGLIIKLTSPGPAFFGQERVGLNGTHFRMWKFRSMRVSADEEEKAGWTVENDPRRTTFGTFLRRTSLDELPQLWNVFLGQMSLVGPRPEQPEFVEVFRKEIPAYMLRHKMRAGITGWAQVHGWRGNTSLEKRTEFDLFYIRSWTLWLDIKILFMTLIRGFVNKNAY